MLSPLVKNHNDEQFYDETIRENKSSLSFFVELTIFLLLVAPFNRTSARVEGKALAAGAGAALDPVRCFMMGLTCIRVN
jgi:hypothetical protein